MDAQPEGNGDGKHLGKMGFSLPIVGVKRQYAFVPAGDITAPELAEAMPLIQIATITVLTKQRQRPADFIYDHLSDGAKRHFKAQELSQIVVPAGAMAPGKE